MSKREAIPDAVRRVLDRAMKLLNDDEEQNSMMPVDIKTIFLRAVNIDDTVSKDHCFGRQPTLPIPVNGLFGEITYLSKLKAKISGKNVFFHRLGCLKQASSGKDIDVYEVVSWDGKLWDILYLDCYHDRKIQGAPDNYTLNKAEGLTGVHSYLENFPSGVYEAAQKLTQNFLGLPLANPMMRHIDTNRLRRPMKFLEEINNIEKQLASRYTAGYSGDFVIHDARTGETYW